MSSTDDFRKKAIHKQIDSNRNIRKVIIPHDVQVGRKNKSINKETLQSLSGSSQKNEFIIRKDQRDKFTRLELNNGHKTSQGSTIRFACGGELKGSIFQRNVGDMVIETLVDDIIIQAQDDIKFRPRKGETKIETFGGSTKFFFDANNTKAGFGTTSPSQRLHVFGGNIRIGDLGDFGDTPSTSDETYARLEMIANGNSNNVQMFIDARDSVFDSTTTSVGQVGTRSNHDLRFYTNNQFALIIDTGQDVGIGTTDPDCRFHVSDSQATNIIAKFDNTSTGNSADGITIQCGPNAESSMTTDNTYIFFLDGNGTLVGRIRSDAGGGGVGFSASFTGAHVTVMPSEDFEMGLIVDSTGDMWANHIGSVSTALPSVVLSSDDESSKVYGVISEKDSHPAMVKRWGLPEGKTQVYVNGLGEGKVWVTNKSGDISNGDYITTSTIPGYGMKQSDGILRNYTVAKCVELVDWSQVTDTVVHDGIEYKKYLIGCTYHCS